MKDSVLITGGSGLLAVNWAVAIRDRCDVTCGLHSRNVSLAGVRTSRIDLESPDSVTRALESLRPRYVVHTAGLTNVEECEEKPELARHVNVDLAINVAHACADAGVGLIHVSTDHLFSGDDPYQEEDSQVAPKNIYAKTKAEAEVQVLRVCPTALVVRTNFYGWGPSYRKSFSDMVIGSLRSGRALNLFTDVFYTPILIERLTHAVHALYESKAQGIFHVVGDDRLSKYEFGLKVADEFRLDKSLIRPGLLADQKLLVRRPHDMSLSNRKARARLGMRLGGVDDHIARLHQEERAVAPEIQGL